MTVRASGVAVLVVLTLAAGACGEDDDRTGDTEAGVASVLAERLEVPVDAIDVVCPEELGLEPGASFACEVGIAEAGTASYAYTIDLVVADDGIVELQRAVIPTVAAQEYLATELQATAEGAVTVSCGDEHLLVRSVGESFECTATRTADGAQFHVVVDVTGVDGSVTYRVERTTTTTATSTP